MESSLVGVSIADRYRIHALLDRGSHGDVYEARDPSERRVAVKVLRSELGGNAEHAARLAREAKAIGMLSHPNIVQLLETGVLAEGRPFLVTELLVGETLREVIDRERIAPLRALGIARQVLDALDHAHRHGIIHRDIKPENIIVATTDGRDAIKVLDFGVAMLADDTRALLAEMKLTQPGCEVFGSPAYIAPEVVLGKTVDARADLYSLGAVLFEMIAGQTPFTDSDPVKLLRHHAFSKVPTLAEVAADRATPELEMLVAEALAKHPEQRFATAAAMIASIDAARAALAPPPTIVVPPAPFTPPLGARPMAMTPASPPRIAIAPARPSLPAVSRWPWATRRRVTAIGAAVATCLLIGVAAAVGGTAPTSGAPAVATASKPIQAVATVATATPSPLEDAHAESARGRHLDAIAMYEKAIAKDADLARDERIRANTLAAIDGRSAVAAVVGLELLARLDPPARTEIATRASTGRVSDVRRRARQIAERDGFASEVDLLASYQLDLKDATTCDDRRAAITGLRALSDRRAIGALRRAADRFPCIAQDAKDAIAWLEAHP